MNRQQLKDLVYFEMAMSISKLSRDERNKVGAIIIDNTGKIISSGYNGPPSSFNDDSIDFSGNEFMLAFGALDGNNLTNLIKLVGAKEVSNLLNFSMVEPIISHVYKKGSFMLHAEMNAILTVDDRTRLHGATIYVTHVPCEVCAKLIAQTGITTVKTLNNKARSFKDFIYETFAIFNLGNIQFEVFTEEELNTRE